MFCVKSQRKMAKRNIGQEILEGIRDVKAYKAGTKVLRVHALKVINAI